MVQAQFLLELNLHCSRRPTYPGADRLRLRYPVTPSLPLTLVVMKVGDFAMMRRMLLGIASPVRLGVKGGAAGRSALSQHDPTCQPESMRDNRVGVQTWPRTPATSGTSSPRLRARRLLVPVELLTGGSALLCGGLLAIRPDGSLIGLPTRVLVGSPFVDWRLPGLLLCGLVGAGYLTAGAVERGGS